MNELVTKIRTSQWMEMIHAQKESGLSVSAWCRENGISENCYYYRQQKLRNLMGSEFPKFVEIHEPEEQTSVQSYNENNIISTSTAYIKTGSSVIGLTNNASEELIARIAKVFHV